MKGNEYVVRGSRYGERLVKVETRLPEDTLSRLRELARENRRSAAAELRVAAEKHLREGEAA